MNKNKKKTLNVNSASRGLIIGFLSYGILLAFIFFSLIIFISWKLNQSLGNQDTIKYTIAVFSAFLMFFSIRAACKLCTIDLFRNYKIRIDDIIKVSTVMNLFFIMCVIVSIAFSLLFTKNNLNSHKKDLIKSQQIYYTQYPEEYADYLTEKMISEYQLDRFTLLTQMFIVDSGVIFGLFSLITIQKNLIEKYNDTSEDEEVKKIQTTD